jgi:hypothetical protein
VKQTSDDKECLMSTQDIVETWRQEAVQEGIKQGIERGIERGVEQGIERGVARSLIDIYEARFGPMPPDVRAVIDGTHDDPTLRSWIKLASTHAADEVTAALRSFRAS